MPEIAGFEGEKIWRLRPFDRRLLHPGTVRRRSKKKSEQKVPTSQKRLSEFFFFGNKMVSLIKGCSPRGFG
jgi:hypothetical protein